jgi:hypothetical protein
MLQRSHRDARFATACVYAVNDSLTAWAWITNVVHAAGGNQTQSMETWA